VAGIHQNKLSSVVLDPPIGESNQQHIQIWASSKLVKAVSLQDTIAGSVTLVAYYENNEVKMFLLQKVSGENSAKVWLS
jgi:hypothetical protein